jgi:hypothetical protein
MNTRFSTSHRTGWLGLLFQVFAWFNVAGDESRHVLPQTTVVCVVVGNSSPRD